LSLGLPNNSDAIEVFDFATCPVVGANALLFDNAGSTCGSFLVTNATAIAEITDTGPGGLFPLQDLAYAPGTEPEGVTDTRITYFANASLTKRWTPTLVSSLAYVRQDDTASGIDGGATIDAVTLSTSWQIADRWEAAMRADWTLRESATSGARQFVTVVSQTITGVTPTVARAQYLLQDDSADSLDTQRWGTAVRLAYRLTKNTVTALQYTYNKQSSNGDTVGQSSDFDDHLLTFTVHYNFEPIGLWW
jgi:hypothetical protein